MIHRVFLQSKTPREFVKTFGLPGNLFKATVRVPRVSGKAHDFLALRQSFPDCTLLPFPSRERDYPQCQVQPSNQISESALVCIRCLCGSCIGSMPWPFSS
jgi:hypothetical protein